jgi:hypothetical protein
VRVDSDSACPTRARRRQSTPGGTPRFANNRRPRREVLVPPAIEPSIGCGSLRECGRKRGSRHSGDGVVGPIADELQDLDVLGRVVLH